jgi:hypothetical protein
MTMARVKAVNLIDPALRAAAINVATNRSVV